MRFAPRGWIYIYYVQIKIHSYLVINLRKKYIFLKRVGFFFKEILVPKDKLCYRDDELFLNIQLKNMIG